MHYPGLVTSASGGFVNAARFGPPDTLPARRRIPARAPHPAPANTVKFGFDTQAALVFTPRFGRRARKVRRPPHFQTTFRKVAPMFAVIKTGGKQYKVSEGDTLVIEKLSAAAGDTVTFDQVLMIGEGAGVTVGAPVVAGAAVTAEVKGEVRGPKLITRKKRQRQTYRRTIGHRQDLMEVTITGISADGAAKPKAARKKAAPKADAAEGATEA